jgi:2-oxoisovalerate dehydrogenase E1 component alpha subunit
MTPADKDQPMREAALTDLRKTSDPISILGPDGALNQSADCGIEITEPLCRQLFRDMTLARRLDEEAYILQRQGELGLWLSCRGQEAAQVGSIRAMQEFDFVFPSYREHAAALCRGITPAELLAQWRGTSHGGWSPEKYRFHIYSLVLATQALHATGYAMGVRMEGSDEVVLAYLGDGASSQGDASEALNWSAVTHAPVLFFCQNNQWAISTPATAQSKTPLHLRASGFGLRSWFVDGNDALAVYAVTRAATASVRAGGGPAFIEAVTYRIAGHSTSDDPRRYRADSEVRSWERLDPLARLEIYLEKQGWSDAAFAAELSAEADDLAAHTRAVCAALQPDPLEDTFRNTLIDETSLLSTEREQFTAFWQSFV